MKISYLSGFLILSIFLILANPTAHFAQTRRGEPATRPANPQSAPDSDEIVREIETAIAEAYLIIQTRHVDAADLDANDLFKNSITSMLSELDPHSSYFDAREAEQFRTNQSSRYFGIGAVIGDLTDPSGNLIGTIVKSTFQGAPANRAGLRYGDLIIEVNGESMRGKPLAEVRDNLRGPRGTSARVKIERPDSGTVETIDLIRDAVSQPSIPEAYVIAPKVGYIALTGGFNQTTYNEFRTALQSLKADGMEELILDLRNNGGGLVNQAFFIANTFLGRGKTVFSQRGRAAGTEETFRSNNTSPEGVRLHVLVNGSTASASEILAGALQDNERATIYGTETFGKGLVQNPLPLDYGSLLLLTIAKYQTPNGRVIQRDYSDGDRYRYYTNPSTEAEETLGLSERPKGGVAPDIEIRQELIPRDRIIEQNKLVNPIQYFSFDLISGRIKGLERFKVVEPITFGHKLQRSELNVSREVFEAFKTYAVEKFKLPESLVEKERELVERLIRTEMVTARYGSATSYMVFNDYDRQLLGLLDKIQAPQGSAAQERR